MDEACLESDTVPSRDAAIIFTDTMQRRSKKYRKVNDKRKGELDTVMHGEI